MHGQWQHHTVCMATSYGVHGQWQHHTVCMGNGNIIRCAWAMATSYGVHGQWHTVCLLLAACTRVVNSPMATSYGVHGQWQHHTVCMGNGNIIRCAWAMATSYGVHGQWQHHTVSVLIVSCMYKYTCSSWLKVIHTHCAYSSTTTQRMLGTFLKDIILRHQILPYNYVEQQKIIILEIVRVQIFIAHVRCPE